jgi:DUF1365 family protein
MEIMYVTLYYYQFIFPNGHTNDRQYFTDSSLRNDKCEKVSRANGIEADKGTVRAILAEGEYYTLSPITVRS